MRQGQLTKYKEVLHLDGLRAWKMRALVRRAMRNRVTITPFIGQRADSV
jgi:hypothetical protein